MERFSLQSYIKICLMDTGNRISEIQRKLEGKTGYDYYNSFQRAVEEYCSDKKSAKPKAILAALQTKLKENIIRTVSMLSLRSLARRFRLDL